MVRYPVTVVLIGVLSACAAPPSPVAPTPVLIPVRGSVAVTASADDCETVPWVNFTYIVREDHVMVWNHSLTCERTVTWRSFAYRRGEWWSQFATGPGQVVTLAPATSEGSTRVTLAHWYYNGERPCDVTEQHDGKMGAQPEMDYRNAAFPPGVTFTAPTCRERPPVTPPIQPPPPPPPPPPLPCELVQPDRVHGNPSRPPVCLEPQS